MTDSLYYFLKPAIRRKEIKTDNARQRMFGSEVFDAKLFTIVNSVNRFDLPLLLKNQKDVAMLRDLSVLCGRTIRHQFRAVSYLSVSEVDHQPLQPLHWFLLLLFQRIWIYHHHRVISLLTLASESNLRRIIKFRGKTIVTAASDCSGAIFDENVLAVGAPAFVNIVNVHFSWAPICRSLCSNFVFHIIFVEVPFEIEMVHELVYTAREHWLQCNGCKDNYREWLHRVAGMAMVVLLCWKVEGAVDVIIHLLFSNVLFIHLTTNEVA